MCEIIIEKINLKNIQEVLSLRIKDEQDGFCETAEQCLREAAELDIWQPVAICSEGKPIGFAMYGFFQTEGSDGRLWLDRFFIDYKYQRLGYGKTALNILINKISSEYAASEIFLSVVAKNEGAINLYKSRGFVFNGEKDIGGEDIMTLDITK